MNQADYLKQIAIVDSEEMPLPGQPDNGYDWRRRSEKQERLARQALESASPAVLGEQWIPVSVQTPERDRRYLVTNEEQTDVRALWWTLPYDGKWIWTSRHQAGEWFSPERFTHYRPLPPPPSPPDQTTP